MPFGIGQSDFEQVRFILSGYPGIKRAILFGSRATGNYKNGSDIDIAVEGENFTFNDILEITARLEDIGLLLKFDIQGLKTISDKDVMEHISRFGKEIF